MSDLDILRPMLELSVVVPAAVLCFLPMKGHLRGWVKRQLCLAFRHYFYGQRQAAQSAFTIDGTEIYGCSLHL